MKSPFGFRTGEFECVCVYAHRRTHTPVEFLDSSFQKIKEKEREMSKWLNLD